MSHIPLLLFMSRAINVKLFCLPKTKINLLLATKIITLDFVNTENGRIPQSVLSTIKKLKSGYINGTRLVFFSSCFTLHHLFLSSG